MNRIDELKLLIAQKDAALAPLRSELAKLQAELRHLENASLGVVKGARVVHDNGQEWEVTKVRRMGSDDNFQVHLYGKSVLKNGELGKKAKYFGILGFHVTVKKPAAA